MNRTPVSDWQQLSALYEQADVLDPATLAEWLGALRQRVHPLLPQLEQMLIARSEVRSNGFLGTLPRLSTHPEERPADWHDGSRIGPYRLLRRIGSGGMAEVWLAQRDDGAFQRQVAIKLLFRHAGSSERDTFAQRFDRERDILASLNHPNIAGLHDAGVAPGGQPWLALEYVEGEMLTRWCDARCLTLADRVRLFRQVLNAVQHAHANLVIHRDIKPGNILVTEQGEVRLLDFGIAKLMEPEGGALAETELTRLAGRPMTPQYASPEQLMGQPLTTASDVYSLGVVLYELLCGERPYELKVESPAQLEHAILDLDPRAPSRRGITNAVAAARGSTQIELRRQLGNDLDAIVLKALAKQPAQRYGSVESLGLDLDRWLDGKTVEARAPSTLYRAGKFVRRHTLAVSLSGMAVVALLVVTAAAVVMGLRAREDSARAVAARDFMLNIFRLADKEKSHGANITARELLETGRKDVSTRLSGEPRLQAELLGGIAKIQADMGEYASADATFKELAETYAALHQPREHVLAMIDRAVNAFGVNDTGLAQRLMREIEPQARDLTDAEVNAGMARVQGLIALDAGQAEAARPALLAARETALRVLGETNMRSFWLGQTLARAYRDSGKVDDAFRLQEDLRRVAPSIPGLGPDVLADMDWEQTNLLTTAGRFDQASNYAQAALPRCRAALGGLAQQCRYLAVKRAQLLLRLGRPDQVAALAPEIGASADDPSLPFLQIEALIVKLRVAVATLQPGTPVQDTPDYARVLQFAQSPAQRVSFRAGAMLALADGALHAGDWRLAQGWSRNALSLLNEPPDREPATRTGAHARMLMAMTLLAQGEVDAAATWLAPARSYFARTLGARNPTTQFVALNAALVDAAAGKRAQASALASQARDALREPLGPGSPTFQRVSAFTAQLNVQAAQAVQNLPSPGSQVVARDFFSL